MKVVYHIPSLDTVTAYRTIYNGFKNAFEDLGHTFLTYTAGMNLEKFLEENKPDLFLTSSHFFWRKQLDYDVLKKYRLGGMKVFCKIDFWQSPLKSTRVNEAKSLSQDSDVKRLIKKGLLGDYYYHVVEQGDERMSGFQRYAGQGYLTVPLAVDKTLAVQASRKERFKADISFIGTNLPQKRQYFNEWLRPLAEDYDLKLYGQDWTLIDRMLGNVQKVGQYFNVPVLKTIRKPKLELMDEFDIYASSKLCVNIHEDYQRKYGGDCNERTFKILASGCLEVTDNVACIKKYFKPDKEIVIAKDKEDWFDKIDFYLKNPEHAKKIAEAGRKRALSEHTYHNRAQSFLNYHTDHL